MITSYGVVGVGFVPTKLAYDFGGGLLIVPRLFDYPGYVRLMLFGFKVLHSLSDPQQSQILCSEWIQQACLMSR